MSRPLASSLLTPPKHLHSHISYAERTPSAHFYEVIYALHVSAHLVLSADSRKGPAFPTLQTVLQIRLLGCMQIRVLGCIQNIVVDVHADMLVGLLLHSMRIACGLCKTLKIP